MLSENCLHGIIELTYFEKKFASDVLECPCVEQIDTLKIIVDQNLNLTLSSLNSSKIIHYCVQETIKSIDN